MRQFYGQTADMNEPTEMNRRNWMSAPPFMPAIAPAIICWTGFGPTRMPASERMWRFADGVPRIPLSYSVRAIKGS
jgi:hypothetical protein